MKATIARELNVTHTIGPITGVSQAPLRRAVGRARDSSIEGILIFCGIGLALTIFAVVFQWWELPVDF